MISRRTSLKLAGIAATIGAGVGVGWLASEPREQLLKAGLTHPPGHSFALALRRCAEALERDGGSRLRLRLYPAAQLGGEREMQEMLALGSLELSVTGVLNLYEPLFAAFELPYLYRDREHVLRVMRALPDQRVAHSLVAKGVRLVGFFENGFRHVTNSKRPIHQPSDLKGLTIRTPENPAQFETFKALGASPLPMSFAELYTALAQGVVDGQENPLQNIWSANLAEVQPHLAMTRHIYNVAYVLVSERAWQRLTPEDRRRVRDGLDEATRWQLDYMARRDVDLEAELKAKGLRFTYPDLAAFQAAVQPAYEAIFQKLGPRARELVRAIQEMP